jgi:hypothetical protein
LFGLLSPSNLILTLLGLQKSNEINRLAGAAAAALSY